MNLMRGTRILVSGALFVLFAVFSLAGCGSPAAGSDGSFVFTGTNDTGGVGQGAVTFNFVKAQSPLTVPNDTTTIDFFFYDGANATGTVVQSHSEPFANTITIDPVTGAAQSVKVIARSAEGYPLVQSVASVNVVAGQTYTVDFAAANTTNVTIDNFFISPPSANIAAGTTFQFLANLTFSNGEVLPANNVMWSATGQATVDANGLATTLNDGAATITAERDGAMSTSNVIVGAGQTLMTITVAPDNPTVGVGSQTQFTATAVDQNGDPFTLTSVVWSTTNGTGTGSISTGGLFSATGIGDVTVTATQDSVSDDSVVNILDTVPVVTLDGTTLALTPATDDVPFSPGATVVDDQANLMGGTLTISLDGTGDVTDATFTAPGTPAIGTVGGDGTSTLTVALDANSTPANIQSFLQTVNITGVANTGNGTIQVNLSDGMGNNAMQATRAFTFFGNDITVSGASTIQGAINAVAANDAGIPSRITVDGTYTAGPEMLNVGTDVDLAGLLLRGNNAGIDIGVGATMARNTETVVNTLSIDNTGVTFDGFEVSGAAGDGVTIAATASNITITNGHFDGPGSNIGILDNGDGTTVTNSYFSAWTQGIRQDGATASGGTFTGNAFVDNDRGLVLALADGSQVVTGNGFSSNDTGAADHLAVSGTNTVTASGNDFANNGGAVAIFDSSSLNAQNNWWGADADPMGAQLEDSSTGTITFLPRLTTDPFPSFP